MKKRMIARLMIAFIAPLLIFSTPESGVSEVKSKSIVFPFARYGAVYGNILPEELEPFNQTGICWHSQRGTLFVVADTGYLWELSTEGVLINHNQSPNSNFQGITHNPSTGLLYIAVGGENAIVEIDPKTLMSDPADLAHPGSIEVTRRFTMPRTYCGHTVIKEDGKGLSGITFVPDDSDSEGGLFYIANQSYSLTDNNDLSAVLVTKLPLRNVENDPKICACIRPGVIDLSGLHYEPSSDHIFVISNASNTLLEYSRHNRLVRGFALPGDIQKGITFDNAGFVYTVDDCDTLSNGIFAGVIKYTPKEYGLETEFNISHSH